MVTWVYDKPSGTHIGPLTEDEQRRVVSTLNRYGNPHEVKQVVVMGLGPVCDFENFCDQLRDVGDKVDP